MEETQCYGQENRYAVFRSGIYPYTPMYMDDRNGKRVDVDNALMFVRAWNELHIYAMGYPNKLIEERGVSVIKETMNQAAVKLGFENHEHAVKHIYPAVPEEIVLLCEYCQVFNDPSTIWKLRPMLYVYWS